jgi:hypothetical protein
MKVYITFGQIHVHSVNGKTFNKDCVAVINCNDYLDGREKAFELFGDKWHMCYHEDDFKEEIMHYFPRGKIVVNPV